MSKKLGAVYTPEAYARILTNWAIRSNGNLVLDMGIGPGIFVYKAYERLVYLGASKHKAASQIFGTEIDKSVFNQFTKKADKLSLKFNNLENKSFFNASFPEVDAIVGNPPYVRRRGMNTGTLKNIRSKTLKNNLLVSPSELSNLSDLYIYFLLYSLPLLKPGGRLATIVADSWLNTRYGIALKKYLLNEFNLNQIITLDRSVFNDAQVKAVLILATKKKETDLTQNPIRFARIKNGLSIAKLNAFVFRSSPRSTKDIFIKNVKTEALNAEKAWGGILKSTTEFEVVCRSKIVKPMFEIADIKIGLEPLAKDFFVISSQEKKDGVVESKYLKPFASSVHDFESTVIMETAEPLEYLFYCDQPKKDLKETKALRYIAKGERSVVGIRGTDKTVIGYHKKERIIKANRPYWYDVKTQSEGKAVAEILLPRFIYKEYFVLWNAAHYIPGGAIAQFFPKETKSSETIDLKIYLAILTSSFTELALRINAQIYGGGTANLRISAIKDAPMIDVSQLTSEQKTSLINSYNHYLKNNKKSQINQTVYEILGLTKQQSAAIDTQLIELREIAESSTKAAHPEEDRKRKLIGRHTAKIIAQKR